MENNFRENKEDLLKEWLDFREETELAYLTEEDKKHITDFDTISERILKNVPKQNQKYVKKQLELLDRNFLDYVCYYNEKYYRNGFVDGVQLISGCLNSQNRQIENLNNQILYLFNKSLKFFSK